METSSVSIRIEDRKRLSLVSAEVQIAHGQAITGTPCEVPEPKNVMRILSKYPFRFEQKLRQPKTRQ